MLRGLLLLRLLHWGGVHNRGGLRRFLLGLLVLVRGPGSQPYCPVGFCKDNFNDPQKTCVEIYLNILSSTLRIQNATSTGWEI